MTETNDPAEMAFTVRLPGEAELPALREAFPRAEIVVADNFIGGIEVTVFLDFVKSSLGSILDFVTKNRPKASAGRITVTGAGGMSVELDGYSADETERLMASDDFQRIVAQVALK